MEYVYAQHTHIGWSSVFTEDMCWHMYLPHMRIIFLYLPNLIFYSATHPRLLHPSIGQWEGVDNSFLISTCTSLHNLTTISIASSMMFISTLMWYKQIPRAPFYVGIQMYSLHLNIHSAHSLGLLSIIDRWTKKNLSLRPSRPSHCDGVELQFEWSRQTRQDPGTVKLDREPSNWILLIIWGAGGWG